MRKPLLSLLAAAAAAGLAGVADSPARAASMDPFTEQQQTDEALNHAIRLYREGDYAEAEKITRTFLRFNPGSAQAHEVLGAILGRMDRDEEALAEIELSIRMNPAIASAHVNRAVLLVGNGDLDGAREALEAAVELDPKLYGAHARLGRVYEALGRPGDALTHYEIAAQEPAGLEPGIRVNLGALYNARGEFDKTVSLLSLWQRDRDVGVAVHRVLAEAILGQRRYEEAVRQYEFALAIDEKDLQTRLGHGVALRALGVPKQAMEIFESLAEEAPDSPAPIVQIAETQLSLGEADAAGETFLKAISMADSPAPIEARYAAVLLQNGKPEEAVALYNQVIDRDGASSGALAALAGAQRAANRADDARATLDRAVRLFPDDPSNYVRLALFQRDMLDLEGALDSAAAGLEKHPDDLTLLRIAATVARDLDRIDTAVKYGERILAQSPDSAQDRFIYATLLDRARMDGPAAELYRDVVEKQRDNWAAMNNLALVLVRLKQEQQALTYARRALQLQPENPAVMHTLGFVLYKVGSLGEAERLLSRSVSMLPEEAEIRYHLGYVMLARSRNAEAKAEFEKALELNPNHEEAPKVRDMLNDL
ncbi:MAG: hypothetical protein CML43_16120 [Rhodobacteraceae bacterium]|nr:hypothetical protein [Paracoccaceae bacterium]